MEKHFEKEIGALLLTDHILTAKDKNFFNYPILCITIKSNDYKVEEESGRIVEGVFTIFRMLDFRHKQRENWGILGRKLRPANTYTCYYKGSAKAFEDSYGYSYRFNFSPFLDIWTEGFKKDMHLSAELIGLFKQSCFLDNINTNNEKRNLIYKWRNAILLFNTAYEFASIEKIDSAVLVLTALLESIFLKNAGVKKKERLLDEIKSYASSFCDDGLLCERLKSLESIYNYRNKFMHEGRGYEVSYSSSRRLYDYQGTYTGMKPFAYSGSFDSRSAMRDVSNVMKLCIDILTSHKKREEVANVLQCV
ncbi:MAG: hypothetical protein FWE16_02255 [Firmicutes bacterium]|nr:hypothetical protein [Bacillota bacterium]